MKISVLIIILLLSGKSTFADPKVLEVGEELRYKVYFGYIKLGEVKFRLSQSYKENGKDVYRAKAEIKSYDEIPMIKVHYIFESVMQEDEKEVFSNNFFSTEFSNKLLTRVEYDFKYDSNFVLATRESNNHLENYSKVKLSEKVHYQDGLSLFYNSRLQSFSNKNFNIPVFINEKESSVRYSYNINADVVTTEAADYGISVVKIAGIAGFEGILGLTGEFAGWYSNDDMRIPIKAQFNVQIGSITMELYSFKRKGWKPPKFES